MGNETLSRQIAERFVTDTPVQLTAPSAAISICGAAASVWRPGRFCIFFVMRAAR